MKSFTFIAIAIGMVFTSAHDTTPVTCVEVINSSECTQVDPESTLYDDYVCGWTEDIDGCNIQNCCGNTRWVEEFNTEEFNTRWVEEFNNDDLRCDRGRGHYIWRTAGLGSNINNLLKNWVYNIAANGWKDLSLINSQLLTPCNCYEESEGKVSNGWNCLFSEMPHICKFDDVKSWENYMSSRGDDNKDIEEAGKVKPWIGKEHLFDNLYVDRRGALSVMAKYLWSHMTPWLRRDVDLVKNKFQKSPYLGMHIRRGDKLIHEAKKVETEDYMEAVIDYIKSKESLTVDEITSIWVASDDITVVNEVRNITSMYFPSVERQDVVKEESPGIKEVPTHTSKMDYWSFVYIIADIEKLVEADIFVGTFSSNIGRLVAILRDGIGKSTDSSISMDARWH